MTGGFSVGTFPSNQCSIVFLSGPATIGKTTQSRRWIKLPALDGQVELLESDSLTGGIFDRLGMPEFRRRLNQIEVWTAKINQIDNADKLIRLEHESWFHLHGDRPVVLAEGYLYMFRRFRKLAVAALATVRPVPFKALLIQYSPSREERILRYCQRQRAAGRIGTESDAGQQVAADAHFHRQDKLFEPPNEVEGIRFLGKLDDQGAIDELAKLAHCQIGC